MIGNDLYTRNILHMILNQSFVFSRYFSFVQNFNFQVEAPYISPLLSLLHTKMPQRAPQEKKSFFEWQNVKSIHFIGNFGLSFYGNLAISKGSTPNVEIRGASA